MAVEILVLTGRRQGDRYLSNSDRFQAGGTPDCELFFDPDLDTGARNRAVSLSLTEDGWTLKCVGATEVVVNNTSVSNVARIRSGDIVRLSPQGPDFSFQILGRSPVAVSEPAVPSARSDSAPVTDRPHPVESQAANPSIADRHLSIAAVAVAVAVVSLVGIMGWQVLRTGAQPQQQTPVASAAAPSEETLKNPRDATPEVAAGPMPVGTPIVAAPAIARPDLPPAEPERPLDPWSQVLEGLSKSVFLLAVEQPKTLSTWPLATGCAIGENVLLTSGSAVTELAKFRQQGWKLWAINEPAGIKAEIQLFRQHIGFTKSGDEPDKRIYFDLGLVNVAVKLPTHASLATREELAGLEPGFALACIGITHEVEVLNRFDPNEPQSHPAKVFIITTLPPTPGPRLLHFRADLPLKPYGGPLVNSQGHVCAVFAESAEVPANGGADLKLHYAPVIDRELIEAGLSSIKSDLWVTPVVPEPQTKP